MILRHAILPIASVLVLIVPCLASAQTMDEVRAAAERVGDRQTQLELQGQIQSYLDEIASYYSRLDGISEDYLNRIDNELKAVDMRWNFFFQSNERKIMENEDVFAMVNTYLPQRDSLRSAVDSVRNRIARIKALDAAISYLAERVETYRDMEKKAGELAMVPQTATLLEKLKAKEQIMSGETDARYQEVAVSDGLDSLLSIRMDSLEVFYAEIRNISEKIQQSEYKPFMQRIKDYLLSFAAVAVLLMFLSMMKSKIDAARQMKENLKKAKEQMAQNDDSIPSI